jgi:hypothetical protein
VWRLGDVDGGWLAMLVWPRSRQNTALKFSLKTWRAIACMYMLVGYQIMYEAVLEAGWMPTITQFLGWR